MVLYCGIHWVEKTLPIFLLVRLNPYCFLLIGPDVGEINNTPLWKKNTAHVCAQHLCNRKGPRFLQLQEEKVWSVLFGAAKIFAQKYLFAQ